MKGDTDPLITRLRAGDTSALNELVALHAQAMSDVAYITTHSMDTAQDVIQSVFINLWERRESLHITGSVRGYLCRASRNRALNMLRSEHSRARFEEELARESTLYETTSLNTADVELDAEDFKAMVRKELNGLPPRCREIFLLNKESGLSYAEIAETLDISLATIHNQMSRAMKYITERLRPERDL
jgi:RNA polymerase sigma-70 factor (ECF subfamily)